MPFKGSKFMNLRMSVDRERMLADSTMFFNPDYQSPIQEYTDFAMEAEC